MTITSSLIAHLDDAQLVQISLENLTFDIYIAQRDADVEHVSQLVPKEKFMGNGNVHVAAISENQDISTEINDILFNLNPDDTIVFLCTSKQAYTDVLAEFEQAPLTIHRS